MNLPRLSELPNWADFDRVALDTETRDDHLKKLGPGVRRGGYITGLSFCCGDENGPAFYLPMRHEGGGNYDDPQRVLEYVRHQAKHFRGELVGTNLQYDLDYLAEEGVLFTPSFFRDIQVSGPLLDEPTMARIQDKETGKWFWGEDFHRMSLNAQAERLGIAGKDEAKLEAWAAERGLDPKADMWKAPAAVVAPYAVQDVRLPLQIDGLHRAQIDAQGLQRIYDLESRLLPVLVKMRRRGVAVDLDKLAKIEAKAWQRENEACATVTRISGRAMSPDDTAKSTALALILEATGVKVPLTEAKISQKTGKPTGGNPSVTSPWLRTLGTPLAGAILDAKHWNKLRTTFCESIKTHHIDGRVHCTFNQLKQQQDDGETRGAEFGRLSSSSPNLQQQPNNEEWRSIYLPDDGGEWACLDFSSQEPRMITHYAEVVALNPEVQMDPLVRAAARAAAHACRTDPNWDNHGMMAGFIFGDDYNAADYRHGCKTAKALRSQAKIIFLGRCYGMGGGKLCRSLGLPTVWVVRDTSTHRWEVHDVESVTGRALRATGQRPFEMAGPEGVEILGKFDRGVPYINALQKMVQNKVKQEGYLTTILGRRVRFATHPEDGKPHNLHKALNLLIQPSSADQTKMAMVLADDAGVRMQLQVHDELDLTIWDRKEAEQLNEIMVHAVELTVPTMCDIETGPTWGQIK